MKNMLNLRWKWSLIMAASLFVGGVMEESRAQTPLPTMPPAVNEVVKLAQAKMNDDVILAYIKSANVSCSLTADQILYLSGQGVSQNVISALMQNKPAGDVMTTPAPVNPTPTAPVINPSPVSVPFPNLVPQPPTIAPAPTVAPAPVAASFDSFRMQLAPYGTWIEMPGYGLCWRPAEAVAIPDWRPYCDRGHWLYTASGWYWQSDYPWGEIAFHYGRWFKELRYGWMWLPDYHWGPAWVCWRHAEGYCGWAPLPPAARFEAGVGLVFNGRTGLELDFGLRDEHFIFVGYDHFWMSDFRHYLLPRERVAMVFRNSRISNEYRVVNGRFINEGIGRERVAAFTHRKVEVVEAPHGRIVVETRVGDKRPSDRGFVEERSRRDR